MTIEEQLASMPEPVLREWQSETDELGRHRRLVLEQEGCSLAWEKWVYIGGSGRCIDTASLRDGNHLAELYRWLVKGEQ